MNEKSTQITRVSPNRTTLVRGGTTVLAKRGLDDLVAQEDAEVWFQKAKKLYEVVPKNLPVAKFRASLREFFRCLQRAANINPQHTGIQLWLGTAYRDGLGTDIDIDAAAKWIGKAAEQGLAEAQVQFAGMLMYGEGVPEDAAAAVGLFRKAAGQNNVDAQLALGVAYGDGAGVDKDFVESTRWFRQAAEQNSDSGQYFLAEALAEGRGIQKNPGEAAEWYHKAASQGMANAQFMLGKLYYNGLGLPEDLEEAEHWFGEAAEQGHKEAKIMLELCLAGIDRKTIQKVAQKEESSSKMQR
jgi:TPR repeat protein